MTNKKFENFGFGFGFGFGMLYLSVSVSVSVQTQPKFRYFGFGSNYGFGRSLNQTATSRATWVATTTWLCINLNFNLNKKSGLSIGSMTAMMNKYDSLCTWFNGDRKLTAPDSSGNVVTMEERWIGWLRESSWRRDKKKRRLRRSLNFVLYGKEFTF